MGTIMGASGISEEALDKTYCIIRSAGLLPCKKSIFNPCIVDLSTEHQLQQSARQFVLTVMQKAIQVGCNTIAFPAIGKSVLYFLLYEAIEVTDTTLKRVSSIFTVRTIFQT